ncbi:DUF1593 domain-containing protein [Mucilaginibacter limnophilus]|uniref:DUF1593 domain-containing protein n=1 Tax=Mucilaginibacter limnophilus TaxID=1932778 RepID=A0A3S2UNN3_9SPHI|nr:DUF1593 domain-containing protein [Mucilaginibacter limnophilus]RVU02920.1 DUF1593 domain-containing protein [Mucilaginibacter limnophilus]
MKIIYCTFLICLSLSICKANVVDSLPNTKKRVFILTDISNEPDDEESMVRFLVYANQFDVEGLVATTSMYLKNQVREDLIRRQIAAYAKVQPNLSKHADGFPTGAQLEAVTASGQPGYGMAAVGNDKASKGAVLLTKAILKNDSRPLWICGWGGVNTLAQALIDAKKSVSPNVFKKAISKLRVYAIADQDDAGLWIRKQFPDLFYIASPATDYREYFRATWTGISGDRHYANAPLFKFNLVDNAWLRANVIDGHGPLGALYPPYAFIMEGDTPSFLGLINNGLGWAESPANGGWGGRYVLFKPTGESREFWTNNQFSRDSVADGMGGTSVSDPATIWRWREHYQHDFAARMDWCVSDFKGANHNPTVVLNNNRTTQIINIEARPGETITLDGAGTTDIDGNDTKISWFVYKEAGTYNGTVKLDTGNSTKCLLKVPPGQAGQTVHIIMQVKDNGTPSLYAYRRAIIKILP